MRKIITAIFIFFCINSYAQDNGIVYKAGATNQATVQKGGIGSDSALVVPVIDTTRGEAYLGSGTPSLRKKGRIVVNDADSAMYYYDGGRWVSLTGGTSNAYVDGGNSFGANSTIGLNDAYRLDLETNNNSRMSLFSTGNVAIGTTTDDGSKLHVSGTSNLDGQTKIQSDNTAGVRTALIIEHPTNSGGKGVGLRMYPRSTANAVFAEFTMQNNGGADNQFNLNVNGTNYMNIDDGQNLVTWAETVIMNDKIETKAAWTNDVLAEGVRLAREAQGSRYSSIDYKLSSTADSNIFAFWTHTGAGNATQVNNITMRGNGNTGVGEVYVPTANLHIGAGSATANTAPLKINSGTLLSTEEAGAIENDGTYLYYTDDAGNREALSTNYYTGWAEYRDTTWTSASPMSLTAGTKYTLYNHADVIVDSQKPFDVDSFYSRTDSTITGRNGDGLGLMIEFSIRPTTATVTNLTTSIDIGGSVGEIYPRDFVLSKGNGVEHFYLSSFVGYTLDTWEANGGKFKVQVDNAAEIYNVRYVLTRTHKAR